MIAGETLFQQADFLFNETKDKVTFGRPLASKVELELSGNEIVIIDGLEAPEKPSHLWYLINYLLLPRAIAGKVSILTTPLAYQEFVRYGHACPDFDFCGRAVNWEKLVWLIEACTINQELFKLAREESVPPMLKAEYYLYMSLRDRGIDVTPQHVLGDYLLDLVIMDKDRRLNIECDTLSALSGHEINTKESKRDFVLLSDGWQILKFSASEILNNRGSCADAVEDIWRVGKKRSNCGRLMSGKVLPQTNELPADDIQRNAIIFGGGPLALVGGAGTGKTFCLAQRAAYLLSQGINPENILLLSYSLDTARLLKQSISKTVEKTEAQRLNVMSFHDLGMKILRENLPAIRRKPPLKLEPSPQKVVQKLLTKIRKEVDPVKLEMAGELDEFYVSAVINMYKAHLILPKQAREDAQGVSEEIIARIYQSYEDQLQKTNRIDKYDVNSLAVQILLDNPELRAKYQSAYEFVLVDEYQDLNFAQDMLVRILASPQDNIFVAGDEDETISENRNACPELLSDFSQRFPNARCIIMEQNWRCHPAIVEHAAFLLSHLERRKIKKDFVSAYGSAPSLAVLGPQACIDESEEVAWIAQQVKALVDAGRNASDIAILYRQNHYEALIEGELVGSGVPFRASFSDNSMLPDEVGDMLAFLKLVMDPDGPRAREAFERVCQIGTKEIDPKLSATIASFAGANNLSYLKAIEIYAEATADSSCKELEQLVRVIRAMNQDKLPPSESIGYLRRTRRLNDYYKGIKIPPGQIYEPLKKLGQLEDEARKFSSVAEFVQHVEERLGDDEENSEDQAVHLKSIYDVKGLEFPIVFLSGLADGILPPSNTSDLEEDRRQFYVAFTRAREAIYLSYPAFSANKDLGPSRFLVESRIISPASVQQLAPALRPPLLEPAAAAEPAMPLAHELNQLTQVQQAPQPVAQVVAPVQMQPSAPTSFPADPNLPVQAIKEAHQAADLGYSFTPGHDANIGDPYAVQKEKVSGLSPYVDAPEPAPSRNMAYLPPSKQAAKEPPAEKPFVQEPVQPPSEPYSPVPPLPPRGGLRPDAARPAIGPIASPSNPPSPLEPLPAPPVPPAPPPAPLSEQHPHHGHDYNSSVDISSLHALRGNHAYLDPSIQGQLSDQQEEPSSGSPRCPSCGTGLEVNARFCGDCGYSLPARISACVSCANPLEPSAKFCGECGTPVAAEPTARGQDKPPENKPGWVGKFLKFLED